MLEGGMVALELRHLLYAYGLIGLAIALARLSQVGQAGALAWAGLRMLVQLVAVGYVLQLVFALQSPVAVVLILLAMTGFALQVMGARVKRRMPHFYRVMGSAILLGCGGVTFYFCLLVVQYAPWYDPRYLIPLAGMIIGNSMNGASLAAERLAAEIHDRRDELETALCLGASARQAVEPALRTAYRAALIPTMNSMAATGIVALPGMMTGQILSGVDPLTAVRYQIAIICAITAAVALTSFLILLWGYRRYFTAAHQLDPRALN